MKKGRAVVLAVVLGMSVAGCYGPRTLSRGLDDWANQQYVDSPWMASNVVSASLLGVGMAVTAVGDLFVDFYYFWFSDARPWGIGVGTPYNHTVPIIPSK